MSLRIPTPNFRLSAITMMLTDYANRFSELMPRHEIYRQYQSLVSMVSGLNEIILDREGMIISWNAAFTKRMGYSAGEIIGQHISLLFMPDDRQIKKPDELLTKATLRGVATHYGIFAAKDGHTFRGSVKAVAIKKRDVMLGFTLSMRQINESKKNPAGSSANDEQPDSD